MSDEQTTIHTIYHGPAYESDVRAVMAYHRQLLESEDKPGEVRSFSFEALALWVAQLDAADAAIATLTAEHRKLIEAVEAYGEKMLGKDSDGVLAMFTDMLNLAAAHKWACEHVAGDHDPEPQDTTKGQR